jgi:hypothetical protein
MDADNLPPAECEIRMDVSVCLLRDWNEIEKGLIFDIELIILYLDLWAKYALDRIDSTQYDWKGMDMI